MLTLLRDRIQEITERLSSLVNQTDNVGRAMDSIRRFQSEAGVAGGDALARR